MNAETPAEIRTAVLLAHTQPEQTTEAVGEALAAAEARGLQALRAGRASSPSTATPAAGLESLDRPRRPSPTSAWCSAATARS